MPWKKGYRLKLVSENQAEGTTKQIYEEIKQALGVPIIGIVFQAYAAYPAFLDLHWRALKPLTQTADFFSLAARLRADSYTRLHSYFEVPDLKQRIIDLNFSEGARDELSQVVDLFHYCEPLILLMVAAQLQAFESPLGHNSDAPQQAEPSLYESRPVLIDEEIAPQPTRKIYDEIKRTLEFPAIPTAFQAFARWPDFLREYWESILKTVQSPVYEGCHYGVRETAFALAREIPVTIDLTLAQLAESGLDDEAIGSLVRVTETFMQTLSGLVLDVAFAKIALEGGTKRMRPTPGRPEPKATPEPPKKERAA